MGDHGDRISGVVGDAKQVAIGKDNQVVSVYADTITWRESTQREFAGIHLEIAELKGWVRGLLIAICVIFFAGFVLSLLAVRQFDLQLYHTERVIDRIERLEQRFVPPVPFSPLP